MSNLDYSNLNELIFDEIFSLKELIEFIEADKVKAAIGIFLLNLCDFLNCSIKLNEKQLKNTVNLIFKNYYYTYNLSLESFSLFVDKFCSGEFGIVYDRIDGLTILNALNKFTSEVIERRNYFAKRYEDYKLHLETEKAKKELESLSEEERQERETKIKTLINNYLHRNETTSNINQD